MITVQYYKDLIYYIFNNFKYRKKMKIISYINLKKIGIYYSNIFNFFYKTFN